MSGEGDEPFRPYSQEDPPVQSGFYHLLSSGLDLNNYLGSSSTEPPPSGSIVAPPHSYSGYDATASFLPASHSAAVAHGGMSGAAHGYSGYGVPMGQYQFPHHSGVFPMADPARHSTSSLAGFHGVPYASLPPIPRPPARTGYGAYGEGSSHRAARVDMGPFPTVSHHAAMGDDSAYSGVPGRRMNRSQSLRQAPSPVHDVCSNDNSMASDSGDDDSSSGNIRAKWDDFRTQTLCELWCEQQRKGNCTNGRMTAIGWRNMVARFEERTGQPYKQQQLKARYQQLKLFYGAKKLLQSGTGGGRRPQGGFKARKHVWTTIKKRLAEAERLKTEEPSWLCMLDDMYRDVQIDFSAMFSSADEPVSQKLESQATHTVDSTSPTTTSGSRKRGSSAATKSTADSPSKIQQGPMTPSSSIPPKKKSLQYNTWEDQSNRGGK